MMADSDSTAGSLPERDALARALSMTAFPLPELRDSALAWAEGARMAAGVIRFPTDESWVLVVLLGEGFPAKPLAVERSDQPTLAMYRGTVRSPTAPRYRVALVH